MIQPNELRIGNWIKPYLCDKPVQVTAIDYDIESFEGYFIRYSKGSITLVDEDEDGWCQSIPLTPEILEAAEFSKSVHGNTFYKDLPNKDIMHIDLDDFTANITFKFGYGKNEIAREMKSLHTLQNLYFALTGQDLKIKL